MNLKNLSQLFIKFEQENELLNLQIKGIYVWQLIRFDVFQTLSVQKNLFEFAHPHLKNRKLQFNNLLMNLKDLFLKHPIRLPKNVDFIIFPHARKIDNIDIYSQKIYESLNSEKHLILYSRSTNGAENNSKTLSLQSIIYQLLNLAYSKTNFIPLKFTKEEHKKIALLQHQFQEYFKSDLQLEFILKKHLLKHIIFQKKYLTILKRTNPKKIFLVTHYSHMALISAAQKLNIKTYEIQHGTISTNHMGYYFPHVDSPPYMPDTLLCHGDHWTRKPPLPKSLDTTVIGAAHVSKLIEANHDKIKNQILIFSQGTVAKDLFDFATKSATLAKDYQFIYRLHPSEMRSAYPTHGLPDNFEIRDDASSFFDDLTRSEFIATVYSTTIYEAMACGAKGIVIGLNGHNAVADVIDNGDAILAKTPDDFASALNTAKPCKNPKKYYSPFNPEIIKSI